jgi:hypothetical protein
VINELTDQFELLDHIPYTPYVKPNDLWNSGSAKDAKTWWQLRVLAQGNASIDGRRDGILQCSQKDQVGSNQKSSKLSNSDLMSKCAR